MEEIKMEEIKMEEVETTKVEQSKIETSKMYSINEKGHICISILNEYGRAETIELNDTDFIVIKALMSN